MASPAVIPSANIRLVTTCCDGPATTRLRPAGQARWKRLPIAGGPSRSAPAVARLAAAALAALTVLAAGCGRTPLYGPPEPGGHSPAASASAGLQLFKRAETGPFARAFQADAATFNRDSRNQHLPASVLGEDAYQVSADLAAWARAMRRAPVPPEYRHAKAALLHGLALLRRGYRRIGDGLLYGDAGLLRQGRADVRAGSKVLGGTASAEAL